MSVLTNIVVMVSLFAASAFGMERATFAGGSFLRLQKEFKALSGVDGVTIGYTGGWKPKPNYTEVCLGMTGHSEAVQITFHPRDVSYDTLLEVFFKAHDPFTKDQQGDLVGTQYRSVVYAMDKFQEKRAAAFKKLLQAKQDNAVTVVTEILILDQFWPETSPPAQLINTRATVKEMLKDKIAEVVFRLRKKSEVAKDDEGATAPPAGQARISIVETAAPVASEAPAETAAPETK